MRHRGDGHVERLSAKWFECLISEMPDGLWLRTLTSGEKCRRSQLNGVYGQPGEPFAQMVGWGARGFRYKLAKKNTWPPEFGAIGKKFLRITLSLGELGADGWEVMEADGPQCKAERETVAAHSLRPW
ncbi:MAG: hypothetical protein U0Q19_21455, partial [Kineosporiaceae bacterium]